MECKGIRSGWGAAIPRTSKEGKRKVGAVLASVGDGRATSVGRKVPAKFRSRRGSESKAGVASGWDEAEGSGKGCGTEASKKERQSSFVGTSARPRAPGKEAPVPSSGVAEMAGETSAAAAKSCCACLSLAPPPAAAAAEENGESDIPGWQRLSKILAAGAGWSQSA